MSSLVEVSRDGHVALLSLPTTTMPPAFFAEFEAAARSLHDDPEVRAVVVRATGKAFSYGLDLKAAFAEYGTLFGGGGAVERTRLHKLIGELQGSFNALAESPVPVIAAVHGRCIGGGLDLATACDIRVCSADAKFSLRETKIAIVADLGSLQRLPGIVGRGIAREMAYTGNDVDAERALSIGLVNRVGADKDEAHRIAMEIAQEIAANAPLTVRGVKQVMDFGEDKPVREGLDYVAAWNSAFLATEDLAEAMTAFVTRRDPEFKGR